jgi:hypothetical protein
MRTEVFDIKTIRNTVRRRSDDIRAECNVIDVEEEEEEELMLL